MTLPIVEPADRTGGWPNPYTWGLAVRLAAEAVIVGGAIVALHIARRLWP